MTDTADATPEQPTTDAPAEPEQSVEDAGIAVELSIEEAQFVFQTYEQVPAPGPKGKLMAASVQSKLMEAVSRGIG